MSWYDDRRTANNRHTFNIRTDCLILSRILFVIAETLGVCKISQTANGPDYGFYKYLMSVTNFKHAYDKNPYEILL